MSLSLEWTSGMGPDEKAQAQKVLMNAKASMALLADYLQKEILRLETAELSKGNYDSPNWALQQADTIGSKRSLVKLLKMIDPIIHNQG